MLKLPIYVLITPARNEAQYIELTLKSVVAQTVRPAKWVIVSDGSTDGTDEIVQRYSAENPWIELVRMPERRERHFAGKVNAFKAGYAKVANIPYEVIGSLDGDLSFDADYFSFLLQRLASDPTLGLVGTPFRENSKQFYDYRFQSTEHVSGACQVFRRECFEDIGGYVPVEGGGIDLIAVLTARMKGWKTRTFTEKAMDHHRSMGSAQTSAMMVWYKYGIKDYVLGCHPVWESFRGLYQMSKKPYLIGGLTLMAGYFSSAVKRKKRPITKELIDFRRREQMQRLRKFFKRNKPTGKSAVHLPVNSA